MKRLIVAAAVLLAAAATEGYGQIPEDALRLGTPGIGVGARAVGMGGAYTGVASDFSALYWNPAGLAQIVHGEFSLGLNYLSSGNTSTFYSNQDPYTVNSTTLNTLGLLYPLPVRRGNAVIAFGFDRENSFASGLSFNGFNPNSSIIQTYAANGDLLQTDPSGNLAWELYLADTAGGKWVSPINGRVSQIGKVIESGGLNNWSVGGAIDVSENLSLGVTVTYLSGSYRYDRRYQERDNQGVWTKLPLQNYQAFNSLAVDDFIDDDISGWNAKFGLMYRIPDRFRLGITIKTPTVFTIQETYGTSATSTMSGISGTAMTSFNPENSNNQFDVHTPWVFGAGASVIIHDLMLSGDAEYTDWTQLEFANANPDVIQQNQSFDTLFVGTVSLRGGAEYDIHQIGLRLRAGFMWSPSPFKGDPKSFDQKVATAGLGILLGESTMLDIAFAHGWRNSFVYNYDPTSRADEKIITNNVMLTLTHRF